MCLGATVASTQGGRVVGCSTAWHTWCHVLCGRRWWRGGPSCKGSLGPTRSASAILADPDLAFSLKGQGS